MRAYRRRRGTIPLLIGAAAGAVLAALYTALRGQAAEICAVRAKQVIDAETSAVIAECLERHGGELLEMTFRGDGSPGLMKADAAEINALENELRRGINERLAALDDADICVAAGTLTGIPFLYERGGAVRMQLQLDGAADISFAGELSDAGVNQTRYQLRLEINCGVLAQLPGHTEHIETKAEYVLADAVIVGDVPSYSSR